ncbi:MAG TPA: lipopolysaccharide kinase InaA family protein [Methylophilus sp.]
MTLSINDLQVLQHHRLSSETVPLQDGTSLTLQQIVRVVPHRRLVCSAVWQGQAVFAKFFFGKRAAYYAARDLAGVKALQAGHIATPAILANTMSVEAESAVLLFEAIVDSENAEALYMQGNAKQRLTLMKLVVETLAQHHRAGILQTDLYLKNFLVKVKDNCQHIYSIDGDGIRQYARISSAQAAHNLAVLCSKMDVLEAEEWLPALFAHYQVLNPLPITSAQLLKQSNLYRIQTAAAYADRKVFRQCTDVNVYVDSGQYSAIASTFAALPLPDSIKAYDTVIATSQRLKEGNTCTVALATFADTEVVIKRYNIKNVLHRISRLLRPTRAAASWANAHRLQLLGIATPRPIALIEQRTLGLRGKAYFLSEYVEAPDVAEYFASTTDKAMRAACIKAIVQLCYRLYLLNISHGDMKYSNIKVVDGLPMLIDLDSMQQHKYAYFAQKAHVRDLRRLMQNWQDDASLYNAFVKVFKVVYADHTPLNLAAILIRKNSQ